jgi:hypothetical protein
MHSNFLCRLEYDNLFTMFSSLLHGGIYAQKTRFEPIESFFLNQIFVKYAMSSIALAICRSLFQPQVMHLKNI